MGGRSQFSENLQTTGLHLPEPVPLSMEGTHGVCSYPEICTSLHLDSTATCLAGCLKAGLPKEFNMASVEEFAGEMI